MGGHGGFAPVAGASLQNLGYEHAHIFFRIAVAASNIGVRRADGLEVGIVARAAVATRNEAVTQGAAFFLFGTYHFVFVFDSGFAGKEGLYGRRGIGIEL